MVDEKVTRVWLLWNTSHFASEEYLPLLGVFSSEDAAKAAAADLGPGNDCDIEETALDVLCSRTLL